MTFYKLNQHFLTSDQYSKVMALFNVKGLSEDVYVNANLVGMMCNNVSVKNKKQIVDSGASQHMTTSESQLNDVLDVFQLNLRVDHPNGCTTKIDKIRNMNLSDVFFIPDFHDNLFSIHKFSKENKCKVICDENNYVIHDSLSMETVETGKEFRGLYYLENHSLGRSNSIVNNLKFFAFKHTWHNRLVHPIDKALNILTHSQI